MYKNHLNSSVINLKNNINHFLFLNNWSLKTLSVRSDIPYDSLKKLVNGKIANPSLNSLLKLSNAFGCSLDHLVSSNSPSASKNASTSSIDISHLPERSITLLSCIAHFEKQLTIENSISGTDLVPVFIPTGRMHDGMFFDSMYTKTIDVSGYINLFNEEIMCGIEITNESLHPTYLKDDILLISRNRLPIYGETGIFIINNKIHIRKYLYGSPSVLQPVNGVGAPITIDNFNDVYTFGRVLTVIRHTPKD